MIFVVLNYTILESHPFLLLYKTTSILTTSIYISRYKSRPIFCILGSNIQLPTQYLLMDICWHLEPNMFRTEL